MSIPGVDGVGVGRSEATGEFVITVMVAELTPELQKALPQDLEGFTVEPLVTGTIEIQPALLAQISVDQLAIWTFDGSPAFSDGRPIAPTAAYSGTPALTMFNADIDDNGKDGRVYVDKKGVSHPGDRAAAWDDIKKGGGAPDAELIMMIDATDWYDLSIRFDYKSRSATGYNLGFSINSGASWELILEQDSIVDGYSWQTEVVDLTSWDAIESQSSLWLRIDHLKDTGDKEFVFDNLEIYGSHNANPNRPTIRVAPSTTKYLRLPETGTGQVSGVIDDPTDPARQYGIDYTLADPDASVESLTVTATVTDTAVIPDGGLTWTGSGASRNLRIRPTAVGLRIITVVVSDGDSSSTYLIEYAASVADSDPMRTRFHTGMSDASSAIAVGGDVMLVANDELVNGKDMIYLFDRSQSGAPLNGFDFKDKLQLGAREMDLEASTRESDTIYWLGSLGNNDEGKCREDRWRFFGMKMSGSGTNTTLSYVGRYDHLRNDLINWDRQNQHGLGTDYYGLEASAYCADNGGVEPKRKGGVGFNVEGLALAPDNMTGFIAFRAPISPANDRTRALIVPLTNMTTLLNGNGGGAQGSARFGTPIELDLDGRGIRSIERNAEGEYLIIAGPHDDANDFRLYKWAGRDPRVTNDPSDNPAELVNLTTFDGSGSWEGIVEVPSPLSGPVQLLLDNGKTDWYANNNESKVLSPNHQKFRSQWVSW